MPPVMVETNITTYHPDYVSPKAVWPTSVINAKLDAQDNETPSGIQYSYMLIEQAMQCIHGVRFMALV